MSSKAACDFISFAMMIDTETYRNLWPCHTNLHKSGAHERECVTGKGMAAQCKEDISEAGAREMVRGRHEIRSRARVQPT